MKVKTFWIILIKILGLSLFFSVLTVVPQFFSTLQVTLDERNENLLEIFLFLIFILLIYLLITRLFVFKPEWLIEKLKLEKNLEEKIDLNIKASTILNVSIAIIGGLMLAGSIPMFCSTLFEFFRQDTLFIEFENSKWIVAYFLKSLIGYLLFTNSKSVTKLIFKQADETD